MRCTPAPAGAAPEQQRLALPRQRPQHRGQLPLKRWLQQPVRLIQHLQAAPTWSTHTVNPRGQPGSVPQTPSRSDRLQAQACKQPAGPGGLAGKTSQSTQLLRTTCLDTCGAKQAAVARERRRPTGRRAQQGLQIAAAGGRDGQAGPATARDGRALALPSCSVALSSLGNNHSIPTPSHPQPQPHQEARARKAPRQLSI